MKRKAEKNSGKQRVKQTKKKGRGKGEREREREREKRKKKEREKSIDIGSVCGSHKQLKNIE